MVVFPSFWIPLSPEPFFGSRLLKLGNHGRRMQPAAFQPKPSSLLCRRDHLHTFIYHPRASAIVCLPFSQCWPYGYKLSLMPALESGHGIRCVPGSAFNGLSGPSGLPRTDSPRTTLLFTVWRLHGSSTEYTERGGTGSFDLLMSLRSRPVRSRVSLLD